MKTGTANSQEKFGYALCFLYPLSIFFSVILLLMLLCEDFSVLRWHIASVAEQIPKRLNALFLSNAGN